jgi:hypothetical protein
MASPFQLEVYFSGLCLFVRDKSTGKVTDVVVRKAGSGHHGQVHTPLLSLLTSLNPKEILDKPLNNSCILFEWRDSNGSPISAGPPGAVPFGSPEDVRTGLPSPGTRHSFFWVSSLAELGPQNRILTAPCESSDPRPGIVAQVPLSGGTLQTSVFAWAEEEKAGEVVRWVPKLRFAVDRRVGGPMKRAAAEGITWTVEAPEHAEQIVVLTQPFGASGASQRRAIHSFAVRDGEKALVGVTNYSQQKHQPGKAHPGRARDVSAAHFGMLYDLLETPVPVQERHIPWIPSRFWKLPLLKNVTRYGQELGSPFTRSSVATWDLTAAQLFFKGEDRPICVEGSS